MIVKDIIERSGSDPALPPAPPRASSKGFPLAKHRSKRDSPEPGTRFPLRLEEEVAPSQLGGGQSIENFGANATAGSSRLGSEGDESLQKQIDAENKARIEAMSEAERKQEAQELVERFGPGLVELMQRRRAERQASKSAVKGSTTSSRTVPPKKDVPSTEKDDKVKTVPSEDDLASQLPNVPIEHHKLAWMAPVPPSNDDSIRFDLKGNILTAEQRESIPTSHGLHHHGTSPDLAGYTVDDILMLSRSSVLGQRIQMLHLLGEIIQRHGSSAILPKDITSQATVLACEILAVPPRAIGLHVSAIDLLYCVVVPATSQLDDPTARPASSRNVSVKWESLLPGLQLTLCDDLGLPQASRDRLIYTLRWASLEGSESADTTFPLLPRCLRTLVLAKPWPTIPSAPPDIVILQLANDLIRSSRGCATAFIATHLAEPLLRYLIPSTWPDTSPPHITIETMRIFDSLGRYGMSAEIVTSSIEIIRDLGVALRFSGNPSGLTVYMDLLATWTTCAIDPHRTTPEHSLTWTRIAGMAWADEAIDIIQEAALLDGHPELVRATLALLIAWLVGSEINTGDKAAEEKARIRGLLVEVDLARLVDALDEASGSDQGILAVLVELDLISSMPAKSGFLSASQKQKLVSLLDRPGVETRPTLRYHLIGLAARDTSIVPSRRLRWMFELFPTFVSGQEHFALSSLDDLLRFPFFQDSSPSVDLLVSRPLLQYTILPSADSIVGPRPPIHTYLKATTTLLRPSSPLGSGLPLASDWIFSPLNELLHSANSAALQQTPPDWSPSETEIVRATLILAKHQLDTVPNTLTTSQVLFNLMKVYMLENEQNPNTSDGEVFRDPIVSSIISTLLRSTTVSRKTLEPAAELDPVEGSTNLAPLEMASKHFLGPETPFFQFYTDFAALFEAISYSDTAFAQLLVSSLAMNYAVDYRRLVWIDHPQLARLINLKNSQVPLGSAFADYLEPKETDGDVLNAYAQALTRTWITKDRNQFMWTVAMSHILHAVWQLDEMGDRLLKPIINSGAKLVIKDMLSLTIDSSGQSTQVAVEETQKRLERVEMVFSHQVRVKVEALL